MNISLIVHHHREFVDVCLSPLNNKQIKPEAWQGLKIEILNLHTVLTYIMILKQKRFYFWITEVAAYDRCKSCRELLGFGDLKAVGVTCRNK